MAALAKENAGGHFDAAVDLVGAASTANILHKSLRNVSIPGHDYVTALKSRQIPQNTLINISVAVDGDIGLVRAIHCLM